MRPVERHTIFAELSDRADLLVASNNNFEAGDAFVFTTATGALSATTRVVVDQFAGQTFTFEAASGELILTANQAQIGDDRLFLGEDVFSGVVGELRIDQSKGLTTILQADTNGDGAANFEIDLTATNLKI